MRTREKRIHFVFYKKITKLLLQNQTKILTSEIERETPKKANALGQEGIFFLFLFDMFKYYINF